MTRAEEARALRASGLLWKQVGYEMGVSAWTARALALGRTRTPKPVVPWVVTRIDGRGVRVIRCAP